MYFISVARLMRRWQGRRRGEFMNVAYRKYARFGSWCCATLRRSGNAGRSCGELSPRAEI
jgi:hypothetical protein